MANSHLNEFLGHLGHIVLQIIRLEIGHILELLCQEPLLGQRLHPAGQGLNAVYVMGIGVIDRLHAFLGTVAKEIDWMLIEPLPIGVGIHHIGLYFPDGLECAVVEPA